MESRYGSMIVDMVVILVFIFELLCGCSSVVFLQINRILRK